MGKGEGEEPQNPNAMGKGEAERHPSKRPRVDMGSKDLTAAMILGQIGAVEPDDTMKLVEMVHELEKLDRLWCTPLSPPPQPSISELKLYVLILKHVRHQIMLFVAENGCQIPLDLLEAAMQSGGSWVSEDPECGIDGMSNEDMRNEVSTILSRFFDLFKLLMDCRQSLVEVSFPLREGDEVSWVKGRRRRSLRLANLAPQTKACSEQSVSEECRFRPVNQEEKESRAVREQCLLSILQCLELLTRLRLYAPPSVKVISYYREIRKLCTSAIAYLSARAMFRRLKLGKVDDETKWICGLAFRHFGQYPDNYVANGHRYAAVLDELLDLEPLFLKTCNLFRDIWSSIHVVDSADSTFEARGCEEKPQASRRLVMGKDIHLPKVDIEATWTGRLKKNETREENLLAISRLVSKLSSLPLDNPLTVREYRLFKQIFRHLEGSMWMFQSDPGTKVFHAVDGAYSSSDLDAWDGETKSREQYLEEIVSIVETIDSSLLGISPSQREMVHYRNIFREIYLLSSKWSALRTFESNCELDCAKSERILKALHRWELKWCKKVEEEYGSFIIKLLFPQSKEAPGGPLMWALENHFSLRSKMIDAMENILQGSHQQLEMLDHGLTFLRELVAIADSSVHVIDEVNAYAGYFIEIGRYFSLVNEICNVDRRILLMGAPAIYHLSE